jgi:UDP-2,4-diacetamido-2,4,6-trideoxy-beta-L-altropyranose hydrolase
METTVLIRVDSSSRIGTGHVSRCLRLAEELKLKGSRVIFLCADLPGNISSSISDLGFEIELFESPVHEGVMDSIESPWPTKAQIIDASRTSKWAKSKNTEVVVVDQYALSELWESQLASNGFRVIALDDLPGKRHSSALVIRPGVSLAAFDTHDHGGNFRQLAGPRYAMIPKEFCEARNFMERPNTSSSKRVLVYFGGADESNASEQVVDGIIRSGISECFIELVLGSGNSHFEVLSKKYEAVPNVTVHSSLSSLSEIISLCDAAVGAGGVSAFERAAAGLPAILFSLSENQIAVCTELASLGMAQYFGGFDSFDSDEFISRFSDFMQELPSLRETSNSPATIDCLGVKRIAELVHPSSSTRLRVRLARPSDLDTYFGWVNDLSVRRNSLNSASIKFIEHREWFTGSLGNPDVVMLLFELDSLPIAQVRFQAREDYWSLNYSLDEIVRGRSWAKIIVRQAVDWLRSHRDLRRIDAVVKTSNSASIAALVATGFVSSDEQADSNLLTLYLSGT